MPGGHCPQCTLTARGSEREGRPITTQLSQLSLDEYIRRLRRTKLIAPDELADLVARCNQDVVRLGEILIRSQTITSWQQKHILAGRLHGFFLGKYKLLSRIGAGGMGAIYLAEHTLMRRRVAIKVLPKDRVREASYLERFRREARAIASLDHPNIIHAYHIDNEDDIHYLVLEYVDGTNLDALVQERGLLPVEVAADYIRQAADGLAHAHARGLVHRDIKPSNLLVDKLGVIKILDLGLARLDDRDRSLTMEHKEHVLGTADYLSPEQALDSHAIDHRADLYSLGCTMYFLLTGQAPFPHGSLAERLLRHQTEQPRPLTVHRPDVPVSLAAICWRLLAKHPENRYATAGEASQALVVWGREYARTIKGDADTQAMSKSDTNIRRFDAAPTRPPAVLPVEPGSSLSGSSLSGDAPWPWGSHIIPEARMAPEAPSLPPLPALYVQPVDDEGHDSISQSGGELRSFLGAMSRRVGPSAAYKAHRNASFSPALIVIGVGLTILVGLLISMAIR